VKAGPVCVLFVLAAIPLGGCYSMRPSSGGAQTAFSKHTAKETNVAFVSSVYSALGLRIADPNDVALPSGYAISVVAKGLTFPTGACFDAAGRLHVVESGYCYGEVFTTPRLLRIEPGGSTNVVATGTTNGPWTGVTFHDGNFFVAEGGALAGGRILKITPDGDITSIVDGLPSMGDHHTDGPVLGPDGYLYFGQGTASNSGVIGEDSAKFGWLKRYPQFHDIPGQDITMVGENFKTKHALENNRGTAMTGGFVPFGQISEPGQKIKGAIKSSGSVLRVRPDGSNLELVAWGFRNPFGLAFSADGKLYVTDNSYDDRGSRPIWGTADVLWQVNKGIWYGWPDFSGDEPLTRKKFKPPGKAQPKFLLANHPNTPPAPVAKFGVHSSADGLDFSRSQGFGHVGQAFIALLGDEAPGTGKLLHAVGFKVVRVDVSSGVIEDFAVNKGRHNGPASKIKTGGLERPVSVKFNSTGDELYIVDFGVILHDKVGAKPQKGTGVIWKVSRVAK
jgi:glucose/arabinose dehydrogenase